MKRSTKRVIKRINVSLMAAFIYSIDAYLPYGSHALWAQSVPTIVDEYDNTGGANLDINCPANSLSPLAVEDLNTPVVIDSSTKLSQQRITLSGGTMDASGVITSTSPEVVLRFSAGAPLNRTFRSAGFHAWNGAGPIQMGSEANLARPILLSIKAVPVIGKPIEMRFWSYQGLNWTEENKLYWYGSGDECAVDHLDSNYPFGPDEMSTDLITMPSREEFEYPYNPNYPFERDIYHNIGVPDQGKQCEPAYLGIGSVRSGPFKELRIKVLNFSTYQGQAQPVTRWSISDLAFTTLKESRTCWHADEHWNMMQFTDEPNLPDFSHWLRTESFDTHWGHSIGRFFEFNVYQNNDPSQGSILEGNDKEWGDLITPAVLLRTLVKGLDTQGFPCDTLGQADWIGLYHSSHFHFQGYHETDDWNPGSFQEPFDFETMCSAEPPTDPTLRAEYHMYNEIFGSLTAVCAAYSCCGSEASILSDAGDLYPPFSPLLAASLAHPVCGAMCIQAMQAEKDACVPAPQYPDADERLAEYTLDNGRTWRRARWLNNRYHNGYPGAWHYNHGHPLQDGDGMLGEDLMFGHDWDRDGVWNESQGDPAYDTSWDHQFGEPLDLDGDSVIEYVGVGMRTRFRFVEDGHGTCNDASGDGYCAGWRIDDVALDYDEECLHPEERFFDNFESTVDPGDQLFTQPIVSAACDGFMGALTTDLEDNYGTSCVDKQSHGGFGCNLEMDSMMEAMYSTESSEAMDQ